MAMNGNSKPAPRLVRRAQFKTRAAKDLRANATEAERKLWAMLRAKQMTGLRFRRQQPIGPYIVDFFCSAAKLIIELDGSQHGDAERIRYDIARTKWLEERGYRILRFSNADFLREKNAAVDAIYAATSASTPTE
jgi:very-short-patch-repair endonuclease